MKTREKRGARWKRRRHQRELGRRARQERREKRKKKGGGGNNKNRNQKGGNKKKHNHHKKKGGGNKKGGGGYKNKNILIPNKHGVKIRSFGEIQLFDLAADPAEKVRSKTSCFRSSLTS